MPITLLDIVLIAVMLISGLLAMVRGFMREVLSITAWLLAAAATLYSYAKLLPLAKQYFNNDIVAAVAVVGGVFLVTLLVVSVLTIRISDMVLDSRVGALDRTLGFLFGLARGLDHRGRGLPVLQLAGPRPQPAGMGQKRQIAGRPGRNRAMADVDVAGRPRKHHLKEAEKAAAGRYRHSGCAAARISMENSAIPPTRSRTQVMIAAAESGCRAVGRGLKGGAVMRWRADDGS